MKHGLMLGVAACVALPQTAFAENAAIDVSVTVGQAQGEVANSTVITPQVGVRIPADKELIIELAWGLTTVSLAVPANPNATPPTAGAEEQVFGLLNPNVGVSYGLAVGRLEFEVGIGLAFPVADADDANRLRSFEIALGSVSAWDPWLYLPNTFGINVPIRALLDFNVLVAGIDGAFFLLVPTEGLDERTTQFGSQAALELYAPVGLFDLGLRAQVVQVGQSRTRDGYLQSSLVPVVRVDFGNLVLDARFNFNFNSPHGLTFANEGIWGLTIGASLRF